MEDALNTEVARSRNLTLIVASVLTGVFGAATILLSERQLGLQAFAPLAQLWTLWALFAASITFGVQQWVIRLGPTDADLPTILRSIAWPIVASSAVVLLIAGLMITPWFNDNWALGIMTVGLVIGTAANGLGRGLTAVAEDTNRLAIIVVGENAIRLVLLVPLLVFDAGATWFGVALLAGFGINVIAFKAPVTRSARAASTSSSRSESSGEHARTLLLASAVGLIGYATMFGGPLLLAAGGGSDEEVSAFFLVVTLARVPFIALLGLLPKVASDLERLALTGATSTLRSWRIRITFGVVTGAVLVGAVALVLADRIFGRVLHTRGIIDNSVYAMVGAASTLALGSLLFTMFHLARRSYHALLGAWSIPVVAVTISLWLGWVDDAASLAWWLIVVESAIFLALSISAARPESVS